MLYKDNIQEVLGYTVDGTVADHIDICACCCFAALQSGQPL